MAATAFTWPTPACPGLAIGTVFGLKTFSAKSESDNYCRGTRCDPKGLDLRSDAKTFATISDVAFAAGLVGVAAGAYFVFFRGSPSTSSGSGLTVGASVADGRTGIDLSGAW